MNKDAILNDMNGIKEGVGIIEEKINNALVEAEKRFLKFEKLDKNIDEAIKKAKESEKDNYIIKLDIGGKKFHVYFSTLLSIKDSFFTSLFYNDIINNFGFTTKEIFIDRDPTYFPLVLDFLKSGTIRKNGSLSHIEITDVKDEFEFYGILDKLIIHDYLIKIDPDEAQVINFTSSPQYNNLGLFSLKSLNDYLNVIPGKGICVGSPFFIIFELESPSIICRIDLAGYQDSEFNCKNGAKAVISLSIDGVNYQKVCVVPKNFGRDPVRVQFPQTNTKFIKIQNKSILGIGYFKVFCDKSNKK